MKELTMLKKSAICSTHFYWCRPGLIDFDLIPLFVYTDGLSRQRAFIRVAAVGKGGIGLNKSVCHFEADLSGYSAKSQVLLLC